MTPRMLACWPLCSAISDLKRASQPNVALTALAAVDRVAPQVPMAPRSMTTRHLIALQKFPEASGAFPRRAY